MIIYKRALNRLQLDMRFGVAMSYRNISIQFIENGLLIRLTRELNSNSDEPIINLRVLLGEFQLDII